MRTTRSLALLGATTALGAPTAIALADAPTPTDAAADRPVLRAPIDGHRTVHHAMRADAHDRLLRAYAREARRGDHRPRPIAALWSSRRLRAETKQLRSERRAAAAMPTGHLAAIAQCESGGDPAAIGGGGAYRGLYQFSLATWQAVGGSGDPAAASVAEQTRRAQLLYDRAGPSQWPVCGR